MPDWFDTLFSPSQEFAEKRLSARFQRHTPPTDWSKEKMSGLFDNDYWATPKHAAKKQRQSAARDDKVQQSRNKASGVLHDSHKQVRDGNFNLLGNSNERALTMRLNSNVTSTRSLKNMLSHIDGRGHVNSSWFGRLMVEQDQRSYFFQHFRHRLHDNDPQGTNYTNAYLPYRNDQLPFVMFPTAPSVTVRKDSTTTVALTNQPMHRHTLGCETFAPINRPAYEDMSWNLNKLKLSAVAATATTLHTNAAGDLLDVKTDFSTGGTEMNTYTPAVQTVTQSTDSKNFRADSAISLYNKASTNPSSGLGTQYKYDMVFKSGDINYLFMNKGDGPLEVELVVFCVKKTAKSLLSPNFSTLQPVLKEPFLDPIKQGYKDKRLSRFGTVNLGGREPELNDCLTNPAHPFLPYCSQTKQSEVALKEVKRIKFSLESGSRRPIDIKLGGSVYDPQSTDIVRGGPNIEHNAAEWPSWEARDYVSRPYLDEHSYTIAIACNGVVTSRELSKNGAILGDTYTSGQLQYYCHYVENLGACSYKPAKNNVQYVNGFMADMGAALESESVPNEGVILIPHDHQVRIGSTNHFTAAGAHDGTTNACNTGTIGKGQDNLAADMEKEDADSDGD